MAGHLLRARRRACRLISFAVLAVSSVSATACRTTANEAPTPARLDTVRAVPVGAFLRVTTTTGRAQGYLLAPVGDTVVLGTCAHCRSTTRFAKANVVAAEIAVESGRHVGRGIFVGTVSGLVAGALVGVVVSNAQYQSMSAPREDWSAVIVPVCAVLGGATGLVAGGILGAMTGRTTWKPVVLP